VSHRFLYCLTLPLILGCPHKAPAPPPVSAPTQPVAVPATDEPDTASAESATQRLVSENVLVGIDVFGVRETSKEEVLEVLGLEVGKPTDIYSDVFRQQLAEARKRLEDQFEFAFVRLSPISYFAGPDAGKVYVTVDVVERGDEERMRFSPEPTEDVADPNGLIAAWSDYEAKASELLRAGDLDLSEGAVCRGGFHCALGFDHPDLQAYEVRFITEVPKHFGKLRRALRRDRDPATRAAAAFLLAYGDNREQVIDALIPSIDDPSMLVRNNTLRVLGMAQNGADSPLLPIDPLLRALRFPLTTDRNKVAYALADLGEKDPARFRRQILDEVADVLLEMAGMSQPNNRDPALMILRALAGEDHEAADIDAWRGWIEESRSSRR
jgi:hypothetical protein